MTKIKKEKEKLKIIKNLPTMDFFFLNFEYSDLPPKSKDEGPVQGFQLHSPYFGKLKINLSQQRRAKLS